MKRLVVKNYSKSREDIYLGKTSTPKVMLRAAVRSAVPYQVGNLSGIVTGGVGGRGYHGANLIGSMVGAKIGKSIGNLYGSPFTAGLVGSGIGGALTAGAQKVINQKYAVSANEIADKLSQKYNISKDKIKVVEVQ